MNEVLSVRGREQNVRAAVLLADTLCRWELEWDSSQSERRMRTWETESTWKPDVSSRFRQKSASWLPGWTHCTWTRISQPQKTGGTAGRCPPDWGQELMRTSSRDIKDVTPLSLLLTYQSESPALIWLDSHALRARGLVSLELSYDWTVFSGRCVKMFVGVKKKKQSSSQLTDSTPLPHLPQRRPPSTPPLPLRSLQLSAKQPQTPVVLRERIKVQGHGLGFRESWPGIVTRLPQRSLTPPSRVQPITEANQPRPGVVLLTTPPPKSRNPLLSAASPNWSVPTVAPPTGRGSESTMMSLLLFCHR